MNIMRPCEQIVTYLVLSICAAQNHFDGMWTWGDKRTETRDLLAHVKYSGSSVVSNYFLLNNNITNCLQTTKSISKWWFIILN